jgi:hypothetical protein
MRDERMSPKLANENFASEASLKLTVGHLLVVWDVLSNKLSGTPFMESLSEDETRAVWALEDLCERSLLENGISGRPAAEWNALVDAAKEYVRSIPVDYLD